MPTTLYDGQVQRIAAATAPAVDVPACPACGHERSRPAFSIEGMAARLVTCERCGLGRLHPLPSAAEIAGFYPPAYYGETGAKFNPGVEAGVRFVSALRARRLARGLARGARVLDLGCGRGVLLSAFADLGLEVHGVEFSEIAVAGADPRVEIRIASRLVEAGYAAGQFDLVVIWHVLEHLPDPRETLIEVRRVLRPGGKVAVAVPNFSSAQARWAGPDWFHLDLPRHLFHFPQAALDQLLDGCGFERVAAGHFSLRQEPFGWIQSALNRSSALPRNALYSMMQRGSASMRSALGRPARIKLWLAFLLGLPPALVLSLATATCRTGATVSLIARSRPAVPEASSTPRHGAER